MSVSAPETGCRVVTGHPAAGADTQAHNRPVEAREPLQTSHDRTIAVDADLIHEAHLAGDSAVYATDGNTRELIEQLHKLLPDLKIVSGLDRSDLPDYVLFVPGPGCSDVKVHAERFANPIEPGLHPGHRVTFAWMGSDGRRHSITVVYLNTGRGTRRQVITAWHNAHVAFKGADVLVAVEVDEGDRGYSDHRIIRRAITAVKRLVFAGRREIILLSRTSKWKAAGPPIIRRAGRAVKRWSPARPGTAQDLVEKP